MQYLRPFLQKHWPAVVVVQWMLFAASTRVFETVFFQSGCYSVQSGFYWFFVGYAWPALIASLLTIPLLFLLFKWMGADRLRDWPASYKGFIAMIMIGTQIIACWGAVVWFIGAPLHLATARTGDHVYQLTACSTEMDSTYFQLYECDVFGIICSQIYERDCGAGTGYCMTMRMVVSGNTLSIYGSKGRGYEPHLLHEYRLDTSSQGE